MAVTRDDKAFLSALGAPVTGQVTDQVVHATGDTRGADAVTKARAMHGRLAGQTDQAIARAVARKEAAEERGDAAATRRDTRREQRAAWKAARIARKQEEHAA